MQLGSTVTDQITGFSVTVTGYVRYITGCNQALVQPRVGEGSKMPDSAWIDEQRLVVDQAPDPVLLDQIAGPARGADRAAPKR